jgi:hypothetical protein
MTEIFYSYVNRAGNRSLTVFLPGESKAHAVDSTHPNFEAVLNAVRKNDVQGVRDNLSLDEVYKRELSAIGNGFDYANGRVTYNGEAVSDRLNEVIVSVISSEGNVAPFARFAARLAANPSRHSRESLFGWIDKWGINLDADGNMVAYKGVMLAQNGDYVSITQGAGIVNGVPAHGNLRNNVGDIVEVPRRDVDDNINVHCSYGLHAGTYRYASGFARGVLLSVKIDPADVVSVPNDGYEKVRVCRYQVLSTVEGQWTKTAVWNGYDDPYAYLDDVFDDDFTDEWLDN